MEEHTMNGPTEGGKAHGPERQLRQGDLPVTPDRNLEPPSDGVTILPEHWEDSDTPVEAELESDLEVDPIRHAITADDWPKLP
jgi:hypothetical protein